MASEKSVLNNLFFFNSLGFGGTEQFLYELIKKYSKDFDIVIAYKDGAPAQVLRMAQYVDIIKWHEGLKIECERAFLNYNIEIIDDLICDDIVLVNHANPEKIDYKPPKHPRINRVINVSQFSMEILKRHYDKPCEFSYNPISVEKYEKPLILMSAFRGGDPARGAARCKLLAEKLDSYCKRYDKRYIWMIFSGRLCVKIDSPNVILMPPRTDVRAYMQLADYGISLPDDMETYGYTNVEFLMYGVPLVTTPLTVCNELKMDESMRLILDWNLENADQIIDQMFSEKKSFKYTPPEDRWNEILVKGPRKERKIKMSVKLYKVRATKEASDRGVVIPEAGGIPMEGDEFVVDEDRVKILSRHINFENCQFIEVLGECEEPHKEAPKKKTTKKK